MTATWENPVCIAEEYKILQEPKILVKNVS